MFKKLPALKSRNLAEISLNYFPLLGCPIDGRPAGAYALVFQCISSDGTPKLNPATFQPRFNELQSKYSLKFRNFRPIFRKQSWQALQKFRKKRTYNNAESHTNNFPSVVFTLLRCVYGC